MVPVYRKFPKPSRRERETGRDLKSQVQGLLAEHPLSGWHDTALAACLENDWVMGARDGEVKLTYAWFIRNAEKTLNGDYGGRKREPRAADPEEIPPENRSWRDRKRETGPSRWVIEREARLLKEGLIVDDPEDEEAKEAKNVEADRIG